MDQRTVFAKHPDVACRTVVGGRAVAVRPSEGEQASTLVIFNATGTLLWDWIDGELPVGALLARLAAQHPSVPAQQREAEARAFLQELLDAGLTMAREA